MFRRRSFIAVRSCTRYTNNNTIRFGVPSFACSSFEESVSPRRNATRCSSTDDYDDDDDDDDDAPASSDPHTLPLTHILAEEPRALPVSQRPYILKLSSNKWNARVITKRRVSGNICTVVEPCCETDWGFLLFHDDDD